MLISSISHLNQFSKNTVKEFLETFHICRLKGNHVHTRNCKLFYYLQ